MTGSSGPPSPTPNPRHLAIIMDGNGRWAPRRRLPRGHGHRAGAHNLLRVVKACLDSDIPCLTVYAFSTENWARPQEEVHTILSLPGRFLDRALPRFETWGVRVRHLGSTDRMAPALVRRVRRAEARTRSYERLKLNVAFDYGGRAELVHAVRSILAAEVRADAVSAGLIEQHLSTAGLPDPDLVVRTSGERRSSNFLIWQSARSCWFFSPKMWPDFGPVDLREALEAYKNRSAGG